MKRFLAALCVIAPMNAHAEPSSIFGFGMTPCARWSDDGGNGLFTMSWVQGYWSALTLHPGYERVGVSVGPLGVIALAKSMCAEHSDDTIATATAKAFQAQFVREFMGN